LAPELLLLLGKELTLPWQVLPVLLLATLFDGSEDAKGAPQETLLLL